MKVPENAREQIASYKTACDKSQGRVAGLCAAPPWLIDLALRALDYEAASGGVTEEVMRLAIAGYERRGRVSEPPATLEQAMQAALLAVAPPLSAAARRKALEEARQMASNLLRDMMIAPTRDYVAAYEMVHKLHDDLRALGRLA